MKRANQCVLDREMSETAAAKRYKVPRTSLQDHVKAVKQGQKVILKPILGHFQQTFTPEYERQLCQHVTDLDNRLMPLTRSEFLHLGYDLAEKSNIDHRFNKEKRMAGKDFFLAFKKRNPDLALRTPEATRLMRATGLVNFKLIGFMTFSYNSKNSLDSKLLKYIMRMKQDSQLSIKMIWYCQ
jgi:hypothetical protein